MKYTMEEGIYPEENNGNDSDYKGNGWSVKKEKSNYVLRFVSGAHGGGTRSVPITAADFKMLKSGMMNIDDICAKYKVS